MLLEARELALPARGPGSRAGWDALTRGGVNATLFHRLEFLEYHPPGRFRFRNLEIRAGDVLVAVMPAAVVEEKLISPAGASFGGPVFGEPPDASLAGEVLRAVLEWARRAGCRRVELVPPPEIYWRGGFAAFTRALEAAGFRPLVTDVTQVVSLAGTDDEVWDAVDRMARKAVRKSRREGVSVEESRDWAPFHAMLTADRARNNATPTHSLEELMRLDELVGPELALSVARKEGALLGGNLMFRASPRVALNFYTCYQGDSQADRPSDLLTWESIHWAKRSGCRWYDFGTSSLGGELNEGLWRFKRKFAAVDYPRARWAAEIA